MFNFYQTEGFALFPCNLDKTPAVPSWRSTEHHISADEAERKAAAGRFIGAWLPPNYVVIDIDRGHKDGQDGGPEFEKLCKKLGIDVPRTMTVRTGSGGEHLYFTTPPGTDHRTLSQKALCPAVDVRTHLGYVIAAGTNGYSLVVDQTIPIQIPQPLLTLIQTRNKDKAEPHNPDKALPVDVLKKILKKVPVDEFSNNDDWLEFVTSCIAVSGNSDEALDAIETWSRQDPNYKDDPQIRKRLESFEVSGGVTAGTFIHIIKHCGVSKYLVDKVRQYVSTHYRATARFSELAEPDYPVDFNIIHEYEELIRATYYAKHQAAAVDLFSRLSAGNFVYSQNDKAFYYFNGNRWVESARADWHLFKVLMNAAQHWYTDKGKDEDEDADDALNSFIQFIGSLSVLSRMNSAAQSHALIAVDKVPWDSVDLQGTLTLEDCVMDFSDGKDVIFRSGRKDEYRRLYVDLTQEDFANRELPENFRSFLKDVFPDDETRKMATYAMSTMISGTGKFRKFQIWNGAGSNGKSTLMDIMKCVIGQRAITYKPEVLLSKNAIQSLTPELAAFRGALVGFASETEETKHISQGTVKSLTGNETVSANPKYRGMIEFQATFQLVLATNYLPKFSAHDSAFISRVLILPFKTCFYSNESERTNARRRGATHFVPAVDPQKIKRDILKERPQILYYLAKRYQEIQENGIPESEVSLDSKKHYVDDNNDLIQFIEDFVEYDVKPENGVRYYFTPTKDLVDFYNSENNTKASAKFVVMRLREVYPLAETYSKMVNGKLTRGLKHIRIKFGAYPEGWMGNYTQEELDRLKMEHADF